MVRRSSNQLFTVFPHQPVFPNPIQQPIAAKLPTFPRLLATIVASTLVVTVGFAGEPANASGAANASRVSVPTQRRTLAQYRQRRPAPADRLPRSIAIQVLQDASQRTGISQQQLWITRYERQTWSNGCLELPGWNEFCTEALVPGWRIAVTDGSGCWWYRTDSNGQTIRLEDDYIGNNPPVDDGHSSGELSPALRDRILNTAARDTGISASRLRIAEAEPRVWNGCLGIDPGDGACTFIAIYGWQVVVSGRQGNWVYHTDGNGNDIRLNETASLEGSTLVPQLMTDDELPAAPEQNIVFRSIQEGGITGTVNEIRLLSDGRVVQLINDRGNFTQIEVNRVSQRQVNEFEQLLEELRFGSLNQIDYSGSAAAADYFTVTLTGRGSTTRYADITQDQLPSALQEVIRAWDRIAITG
jgi:hypothetical protein